MIPFLQVNPSLIRNPSFTTVDLSPPIFTFPLVRKIYNPYQSHSESCSSQWSTICLKSISSQVETMRRKYSIPLDRKSSELSLLSVFIHFISDDADQLLKNRETISREIRTLLFQRAQDFKVNVEDVSFMHLGFGKQYAKAVERRAVQQQLAEMQKFIVLRD